MEEDKAPTMAQLVQGASDVSTRPAAASLVSLRGGAPDEKLLPIGEGAYQSGEAIMQRTMDSRMACEKSEVYFQAHWAECYKYQGDFIDGPSYGFKKFAGGSGSSGSSTGGDGPGSRSGAAEKKSFVCVAAALMTLML